MGRDIFITTALLKQLQINNKVREGIGELMKNNELSQFIAELIMSEKNTILEAYEKDDISIIRDEVYEYIENCIN